jgi:hypothetical protein
MRVVAKRVADALIRLVGRTFTPLYQVQEIELSPEQQSVVPMAPANAATLPRALQQQFNSPVERPRKAVYYYAGVSVSWHGLVMKGLELFRPSLPYPAAWNEFSGTYLLRQWAVAAPRPLVMKEQKLALVYDFWSVNNYYHWLIDALPRLLLLQQVHPDCILLLPEGASTYMLLSCQALGFTKFQYIPKNRILRGVDIIMPGHVAAIGRQDAILLQQVRQQLIKSFVHTQPPVNLKRRIFASRRSQHTRCLLNEEDIMPLLLRYGIELISFDGMTLPQQIELMQTVDLYIGVHGANMTNLLFSSPNTSVVELMDTQHPNLCYFNMAINLSFNYWVVPCDGVVKAGVHENNYDLQVDLTALEQAIARHFKG